MTVVPMQREDTEPQRNEALVKTGPQAKEEQESRRDQKGPEASGPVCTSISGA